MSWSAILRFAICVGSEELELLECLGNGVSVLSVVGANFVSVYAISFAESSKFCC